MSDSSERPKVIIDEDWKSQAQAEKERLAQGEAASAPTAPKPPDSQRERQMPPPTFDVLISTLATQALLALGKVAHPTSGQREVKLDEARHFIDTITMLEGKTAGNRTPDESRLLEAVLYELRTTFVAAQTQHK